MLKLISMAAAAVAAASPATHTVGPDDIARLRQVSDPQVDPSGTWVAYAVAATDVEEDKDVSHIWMSRWDGSASVQLTSRAKESESTPRWSPDGRWLAFVSSRGTDPEDDTLWLLDRRGGEAQKLPGITGSVQDMVWSPDGKTLALIVGDPDPDRKANAAASAALPAAAKPGTTAPPTTSPDDSPPPAKGGDSTGEKKPRPIVIDRFRFKQDIEGYQRTQRKRLWLYDLATHHARRLTTGDFDEALPAFAPDGRTVAFVSKHGDDPDRTYDWNIYTVGADGAAAAPHAVTTYEGPDDDPDWNTYPAWSPDGRSIAYLQGGPVKLFSYGVRTLAVAPAAGGTPRILTASLDRNVSNPSWSADGRTLRFRIEDDGMERIAEVAAAGGAVRPVIGGERVFAVLAPGPKGHDAVLMTDPAHPAEVFALDHGRLRALSHQNGDWLKTVVLAAVTPTRLHSKDGTAVSGFVVTPPAPAARPYPLVLFNHGGPQGQFDYSFEAAWQILAGHGYLVVATNPRGSTGRGQAFASALYADWGGPAVPDALAAVDDAVARGIADPARLYVGGWSYGGMLTNYLIASDTRFRGAVSGASIANVFAGYGTDQYIRDYEVELGRPWENPAAWQRVSYPFYHNDRIVTPTLFMAGDKDFNVPLLNSEQMYQALRSRGIETRLIIYPGQFHGLTRPSFLKDRMQRWLGWYDAHGGTPATP